MSWLAWRRLRSAGYVPPAEGVMGGRSGPSPDPLVAPL
uniref:Uncharacterized protein n=1 Tax=Anguilla anguilla TaxID=7936 RepID=A0A0E9PS90_ANGAN